MSVFYGRAYTPCAPNPGAGGSMNSTNHPGPEARERYSVSPPDEHGNRFITVLGEDGAPLPAKEPSPFDREGA